MRKAAELLAGKAAVVQVNCDDSPTLSARFGVRGIPVTHLLRHAKTVDQISGAQPVEALLAWFRRWEPSA